VPYANSDRAKRLPGDWGSVRRKVLRRDRWLCYICGAAANEVDHVVPGDDHDPSNLSAICHPCHLSKSGHEGGIAQGRFS
jgi:5-methylcytosine-specific restriction endonuclease McrA